MAAPGIRVVPAGAGEPPAGQDAPAGSILSQLRAAAAAQQQVRELELAVGGEFGERLVVVYGVLPFHELERYVTLAGAGRVGELTLAVDMAVASCRTLLWREHGDVTDLCVKLDAGLWSLMAWPLPEGVEDVSTLTASDVMRTLFGGNAFALVQHLERLSTWIQDPGGDAVGEASPAT